MRRRNAQRLIICGSLDLLLIACANSLPMHISSVIAHSLFLSISRTKVKEKTSIYGGIISVPNITVDLIQSILNKYCSIAYTFTDSQSLCLLSSVPRTIKHTLRSKSEAITVHKKETEFT